MTRKTLSDISRSEMPKSVLLSYLLERPGFLSELRRTAVLQDTWSMRSITTGVMGPFDFSVDSAIVMAAANFHARRDLGLAEITFVEEHGLDTPSNEIDVVAVIENVVAIGFELKWKSRIGNINAQLFQERECLKLVARYYNCEFISNVVVIPRARLVQEADAVITFDNIHDVLRKTAPQADDVFMQMAKRDLARAKLDELWDFVTDTASLLARSDSSPGGECVGYEKGLPYLSSCSITEIEKRPHWKISKRNPDKSWIPLVEVANIIRQKLAESSRG